MGQGVHDIAAVVNEQLAAEGRVQLALMDVVQNPSHDDAGGLVCGWLCVLELLVNVGVDI